MKNTETSVLKNFQLQLPTSCKFLSLPFKIFKKMNAFIEELKWRGLYADMMPGTDEQLNKGK